MEDFMDTLCTVPASFFPAGLLWLATQIAVLSVNLTVLMWGLVYNRHRSLHLIPKIKIKLGWGFSSAAQVPTWQDWVMSSIPSTPPPKKNAVSLRSSSETEII